MKHLKATWGKFDLQFKHTFTVAQFSRNSTPIVILKLKYDGKTGYGEACMPPYLGETTESVFEFLNQVDFQNLPFPSDFEKCIEIVDLIAPNNNAAKAAIDIALHDLLAKIQDVTINELLQIPTANKLSSFTIGIDTIEKMIEKTLEAKELGFKVLKIKIGTKDDFSLVENILSHWGQPFSVDVNQGWDDFSYAKEMTHFLKEKEVLFIEQPFHKDNLEDSLRLKELNLVPIIADEAVKRLVDLEKRHPYFDGVNIKLMKSTGLNEAQKMIAFAKDKNLKIVIGCMAESSCAATAASALTHHANWVDIDAPYLITNDPFQGIKIQNGIIQTNTLKGIGIIKYN